MRTFFSNKAKNTFKDYEIVARIWLQVQSNTRKVDNKEALKRLINFYVFLTIWLI